MLEAIRVHAQGKLAKLILALITIPFALWGVESYIKNGGDGPVAAKVDDQKISQQEFAQALKDQQDRMRAALGNKFDPAILERPELRMSVLKNLIDQRLIMAQATKEGLAVSDAQLAKMIGGIEAFQEGGKFSQERYERILRQQGMNPAMFERRLRQDLVLQTAQEGVGRAAYLPKSVAEGLVRISEQQREVSQAITPIEQFMARVKVDAAMVKDYFDKHQDEFKVPEQVRLEYVVLSPESLMAQVSVGADEVAKYYDDHQAQFGQAEERQASHILISAATGASEADMAAARAKATKIAQEAKQNPANFAQLAKQYSQDQGSSGKGGDLGFFGRGAMVKPFEDAVFKMSVGDISDPVQSDFGFHIIKLATIKPGKVRPLAEVRDQIERELKKQKAGKKFSESADNFNNLVYENGDSLKVAAQAFGLKVEQSGWTSRMASDTPLLNNPKLLQAVFGDEVLKDKRNAEAVEVAPNTLVAARLLEHKAASIRPLAEVSKLIEQRLQREQAVTLAQKWGKDALTQLQQGKQPPGLNWGAPQVVGRERATGFDPAVLKEAFKVGGDKLPMYAGLENGQGGYTLIKISRLVPANAVDDKTKQAYAQRFSGQLEREYATAYLESLRQKAKIDIPRGALEKGEQ